MRDRLLTNMVTGKPLAVHEALAHFAEMGAIYAVKLSRVSNLVAQIAEELKPVGEQQ